MTILAPRYEFRVFAPDLSFVLPRLYGLGGGEEDTESAEQYLISHAADQANTKIRNGRLEVKILIHAEDELEQWLPYAQHEFPLPAGFLRQKLLPLWEIEAAPGLQGDYGLERLLSEVVDAEPGLFRVGVSKRRAKFNLQQARAEYDELRIDGQLIQSVAIESADPGAVLRLRKELGLAEDRNENYVAAIKRLAAA